MKRLFCTALIFLGALCHAAAAELELRGPFTQGGMIVGQTAVGATVSVNGRSVRVSETGAFVFGIHRDDAGTVDVSSTLPDGRTLARTERIAVREYDIQRIDGLPPKKVSPPEK